MAIHSWHNPDVAEIFAGFIHPITRVHAIAHAVIVAITATAHVELIITIHIGTKLCINTLETGITVLRTHQLFDRYRKAEVNTVFCLAVLIPGSLSADTVASP